MVECIHAHTPHCDLRDTVGDQVVEIVEFQEVLRCNTIVSRNPPVFPPLGMCFSPLQFSLPQENNQMNGIIYIVGLIVVVMFILSFLGLR